MELRGKKIVVVGIGESGKAASLLLKDNGANVYVTDIASSDNVMAAALELKKKGIFVETGRHREDFIRGAELIVVSPGVTDDSPAIRIAESFSIPIISEIELAHIFCKAPIIAVTGTNGKTTTVSLIGIMLNTPGNKTVVCGNIGEAFCRRLNELSSKDTAVVEVSSFQLKRIKDFRPRIAAILNITQNHFDWHRDFKEYFDAKKNIFKNQRGQDFTVLNYDDVNITNIRNTPRSQVLFFSVTKKVEGAYCDGKNLLLNIGNRRLSICRRSDIKVEGAHNLSNILCASLCAYLNGARPGAIGRAISAFEGLDHRFKAIALINGIKFIDDSKSTTVESCRAALASCSNKAILIAGGRDKGSDFRQIRDTAAEKVKALILIGEAKDKIKKALRSVVDISEADCMEDAVRAAFKMAKRDDVVLLSPMCASFDMFRDYKHRGEAFCKAVARLERIR